METLISVITSVLASTGIVTLIVKFMIESALKKAQDKKKLEQEWRETRYKLDDEWEHEIGRVLFWIHHGIKLHEKAEPHEYWNGELQKAMDDMKETEERKKDLNREQLAEINKH
jgi:hypothetical protein